MPKAIAYKKGSIVYFEGDNDDRVFILQKGLVSVQTVDIETETAKVENLIPGEFFGVKSALGHFPREETVTVLRDSVCISMTIPEFEKLASSNKEILMKMLRVFSGQLRNIHKRTEMILHTGSPTGLQQGMFDVAMAFYNDEQFKSCCDVCNKFFTRFPGSALLDNVKALFSEADLRLRKLEERKKSVVSMEEFDDGIEELGFEQFFPPAFKRFSKTFENGSVIISEFEEGDSFYLIQSGRVQLVKCVNGEKKNLDILKPGEFFGEMAILDNSPRSATCVASGKVEALEFNKANFEVLITGNPQIALILLKLFCKRIYDQKRRLRILTFKDLQARVADVFLMFDEMNPPKNPRDNSRHFKLTVQDLSHWAGISYDAAREEVDRFVTKHKIDIYENEIYVHNIVDMKRTVDSHLPSK